jgi:formylglycine-generating enzyme required for sulfatase activity
MAWPLSSDYSDALQNPRTRFNDPELRQADVTRLDSGEPVLWSGGNAAVFQVRQAQSDRKWAVKCFTRKVAGQNQRYRAISDHLQSTKLPFRVAFRYLPDELLVSTSSGAARYPVVKMDWVDGLTLDQFAAEHLDKPNAFAVLAKMWTNLARLLRRAQVAHADLQHGNVILVQTSAVTFDLKLIDYDGMYVPGLEALPSGELGQPNYQHPLRRDVFDLEIDRFSHLVVYTTLRALAFRSDSLACSGERLWARHHNRENLLFLEKDFKEPAHSELFRQLWQHPDSDLQRLAGHLMLAAMGPLDQVPLLDEVHQEGGVEPLSAAQRRQVSALLGPAGKASAGSRATTATVSPREQAVAEAVQPGRPRKMLLAGMVCLGLLVGASCVVGFTVLALETQTPEDGSVPMPTPSLAAKSVAGKSSSPNKSKQPETKKQPDTGNKRPADKGQDDTTDKVEPLGLKFRHVPKGTFWMGWDSVGKQSKQVTIAADFELAAHTVTQEQWQEVMGYNPSFFSRQGQGREEVKEVADADLQRFPVENVSWDDVQQFLKKLNAREKGKGWHYRLPSEAEWEYACRGAATSREDCSFDFYFDRPTNDLSSKQANFNGQFPAGKAEKGPYLGRPTKVGSYAPNKLGLFDMHGNVWQWCAALWDARGLDRVIRGGSWSSSASFCLAGLHNSNAPSDRISVLGFRLARVPSNNDVTDKVEALGLKFVHVPKGTFWKGGGSKREPTKQVEIEEDFELGVYTVTQQQWQAVMGNNPSWFSRQGNGQDAVKNITDADLKRFPVENVSWDDVQEFLKKLNEWERDNGWVYRLPSEDEWEYACRGAATSKKECSFDFYLDTPTNILSSKQANFCGNKPAGTAQIGPFLKRPKKVGSYTPNKLGLYDMHGNVWQWCADIWGAASQYRVVRGGYWNGEGQECAAGYRFGYRQSVGISYVGIRLVRAMR